MGKGRPRAIQKGVPGQSTSTSGAQLSVPLAPVYYPTEEEFKDPLEFISKIRPEAEQFGICRIVPPKSWNPPFALNLNSFSFPTKSQDIHLLQARPPSCDPETFELEYGRFLKSRAWKKPKRVVFEGENLDMCRLFNAVKRFGGYDKVCGGKKWGDVFRFISSSAVKASECSKHVLCQLYGEHLYDYEEYQRRLERRTENCKRGRICEEKKSAVVGSGRKRRRKGSGGERVEKVSEEKLDQICEQCKSGLHGEVMLLCDRCDKGWHLHCLSPPLDHVPAGNWYCLECVNSDKDQFGFVPGKQYTLEAFRRINDRTRRKWFGPGSVTRAQVEKRFWEIVEGKAGELEVMYGSDLDTSVHGSGFPRANDPIPSSVETELWKKYISSPWNLNNLPKLQGSLLRVVQDNIAGVMVPWLYIGMLFSSFCWHIEDHCFYSMNYLHWGEPKCWYGVPGSKAHAFEQVMRNTLPDLFDAQPDLLFQLVTMLNPSVLLDNGVPVYGVVQEPGNFVITFPRSFHGGFNFGLNCAEAVNFAPADWLPHGGFGAEQYQLYHKPAVLSHEELLYVVAKNSFDAKVLPYLKKELLRLFSKEKTNREDLWKSGIIKSSQMSPRNYPDSMGTEEDPICIICQQYLFLSAVVCSCRPSTFVCLEHWKHLCECNSRKHRLLYRHSLAQLGDLVHLESPVIVASGNMEGRTHGGDCQENISCLTELNSPTKKVKGVPATQAQLAEGWLCNACHLLQTPFSETSYASALKEAEQFLWAGHEMDPVRDMVSRLTEARKWAVNLRTCLAKVDNWLHFRERDTAKVCLSEVNNLLNFSPLPCNEPEYSKLKAFAKDARMLHIELKDVLSSSLNITIGELEILYSKAVELPIYVEEVESLGNKISSAKDLSTQDTPALFKRISNQYLFSVCGWYMLHLSMDHLLWIDSVRQCILEKKPGAIEVDTLYKLKKEMMELHVQLPEAELLLNMLRDANLWELRCREILAGPLKLKELEYFLHDADGLIVSIPELHRLREYQCDAHSWINHFHDSVKSFMVREDHDNIVMELTSISKSGAALIAQVDELHLVEVELKKSSCREKASKALSVQMPLDSIQQLMMDAMLLHIENEKMFQQLSEILAAALSWEEKAKFLLGRMAQMSEFVDIIRISEGISVILPSLPDVQDAFSFASEWIRRCQPFLLSGFSAGHESHILLKIEELKELVAESKLLKVNLDIPARLQCLLNDIECWERKASSLVDDSLSLLCLHDMDIGFGSKLLSRIEEVLGRIDSAIKFGISLGFDFRDLPKLQRILLMMKWSFKVLSLCSSSPFLKDVDCLIEDGKHLPVEFTDNYLVRALSNGARCLKKALTLVSEPRGSNRGKLKDIEEILGEVQNLEISFPVVAAQLQNAIEKHECWLEKARKFLQSKSGENTWSSLLKLKEVADSDAFACPELDKILLETERVQHWILRCHGILKPSVGEVSSLTSVLLKIEESLARALCIYRSSKGCRASSFYVCCWNGSEYEDVFTCLSCEDRYHFSCMGPPLAAAGMTNEYACPFCLCMETGVFSRNGGRPLVCRGKRPELKLFHELLSDGEEFYVRVQERELVKEIIQKAAECKSYLAKIVNQASVVFDKDLSSISESFLTALKAVAVAGVYDHQGGCNLESALLKNSWRIRVKKILTDSSKPGLQQIQRMIKEGFMVNITIKDHFMSELEHVKQICLEWADIAKKIASDSGALELSEVFKAIDEGENLPVHMEREMKLLKARSVLYCICRKPYDQRAMIACDQCDEWYHFDCINLQEPPPKTFFCPACNPINGELLIHLPSAVQDEVRCTEGEPQTPPPRRDESKRRWSRKATSWQQKIRLADMKMLACSSEIDRSWRGNRRCFRRRARRRRQFESLMFFNS